MKSTDNGPRSENPFFGVTFDWIWEALKLFLVDKWTWIGATLIYGSLYIGATVTVNRWFGSYMQQRLLHVNPTLPFPFLYADTSPLSGPIYYGLAIAGLLVTGPSMLRMAVKKVKGESICLLDAFSGLPYAVPILFASLVPMALFAVDSGFQEWSADNRVVYSPAGATWAECRIAIQGITISLLQYLTNAIVLAFTAPAYAMACDGFPPGLAVVASIRAMARQIPKLVVVVVVLELLPVVSAILFGLGLILGYPVVLLVCALAYRDVIGLPAAPTHEDAVENARRSRRTAFRFVLVTILAVAVSVPMLRIVAKHHRDRFSMPAIEQVVFNYLDPPPVDCACRSCRPGWPDCADGWCCMAGCMGGR
ncbi:MAG: hypothetical protein ACLQVD_22795 [Capsulimonadaceae bacterium]